MAHLLLTAVGRDRPGLVERLTALVVERGGNVEGSRMSRLGGEFAMLVLVALPDDEVPRLEERLEGLLEEGLFAHARPAEPVPAEGSGRLLRLEVEGADHMGIVHRMAGLLASAGANIHELDTRTVSAPMSGQPLFEMHARVELPDNADEAALRRRLGELADEVGVEATVSDTGGR